MISGADRELQDLKNMVLPGGNEEDVLPEDFNFR
jgi:hypothetical protein